MKDQMRLLVLQIAALASIFSFTSPRLAAGVRLLQTLASPEIWDQIWSVIVAKLPSYGQRPIGNHSGVMVDPFGFLDELSRRGNGRGVPAAADNAAREQMRIAILQVAAIAMLFAYRSARLMAAIGLLQTITSPEIWNQVWAIANPGAGGTGYRSKAMPDNEDRDVFEFSDELARLEPAGAGEQSVGGGSDAERGPEVEDRSTKENIPNSP